jgi:hypothetical protein
MRGCNAVRNWWNRAAAPNCGDNLPLIGAIRVAGWVTMSTWWYANTADRFVTWVCRRLAPKLRTGDIAVMDNMGAHNHCRIEGLIAARGARMHYLPSYACDLNPHGAGCGLHQETAPRIGRAKRLWGLR